MLVMEVPQAAVLLFGALTPLSSKQGTVPAGANQFQARNWICRAVNSGALAGHRKRGIFFVVFSTGFGFQIWIKRMPCN